ncbi:MAG TPA: phosphoglucosamine mutase [Gammaproteobacteria bacterium]|nr:phosphoglucosamine mutase [Gammaproteobacteria bacterium]
MGRRFFGTDGIRGTVGEQPMSADFVLRLGQAAGRVLAEGGTGSVLIGKDTRISGYMFESALQAGFSAAGVDVLLLGPMPTPGIAYLTKTFRASAGVVISASHNPYADNGVKFFARSGHKLDDSVEQAIEKALEEPFSTVDSARLGKAERINDAQGRYIEFCKSTIEGGLSLRGLTIVVDCAHGATYHIAPHVFRELGARVVPMGTEPSGLNINDGCGSTHPVAMQQRVTESGADLGLAFDGDGDRVVMADAEGRLVDGDEILYVIAEARARRGQLAGPVVGTLMSNLGLELALQGLGVAFRRAAVGDRYVLETLRAEQGMLGGEPSGHVICLDRTSTGDGIVTALQVLAVMVERGASLRELVCGMHKLPQTMINVPATQGHDVIGVDGVTAAVRAVEDELGGRGRVVLRPSGTEPLVRVMVEGEVPDVVAGYAERIAEAVRRAG